MPTGTPIGKELNERVIDAFLNNEKQADIARRFQLPRYSVSKIIIRYNERGHLNNNPKSERPRKTTINMDRRIKRISENDPWKSASKITAEIPEVGVKIDAPDFNLQENWTVQDWRKVLFSDETRYKLFNSDGMKRVRRPINTRFNPKYVTPTVKHDHGSVFLWGCFSWNSVGPLSFTEGNMDRFIYRDILQDVMLPYAEWKMPLRFIFQQDNDPKHTSALVSEWFQNNNIHVLQWPAQSPDLNPIENLWEEVERRIRIQRFPNKFVRLIWNNHKIVRIKTTIYYKRDKLYLPKKTVMVTSFFCRLGIDDERASLVISDYLRMTCRNAFYFISLQCSNTNSSKLKTTVPSKNLTTRREQQKDLIDVGPKKLRDNNSTVKTADFDIQKVERDNDRSSNGWIQVQSKRRINKKWSGVRVCH
ncbi:Transposable element Tcb1 transposase-like Protein [Tribolium castaneum]|uniref:Transposable element Tcb1 transposase-like Protein n=1 Tax=Tribolium castaneum TaxID=7070 RepID=D6WFZ9_TRICA|nr:Transposable element Tcb1 transposase-like Protein [Tribolium castaneum]